MPAYCIEVDDNGDQTSTWFFDQPVAQGGPGVAGFETTSDGIVWWAPTTIVQAGSNGLTIGSNEPAGTMTQWRIKTPIAGVVNPSNIPTPQSGFVS